MCINVQSQEIPYGGEQLEVVEHNTHMFYQAVCASLARHTPPKGEGLVKRY